MGDNNAGAVVEGGWASTGRAGAQDHARVDELPANECVQIESQNRKGADGLTAE